MDWVITKQAGRNAFLAFVYVAAVGTFLSHASTIFGPKDTAFTPVAVLMLLVFSASLMGILIFGQPVMWFIDGKRKEALRLMAYTMGSLLVLLILTFAALLIFQ